MKKLTFLLVFVLNLSAKSQNSDSYAIFSEAPEKRISYTNLSVNNYFIEFFAKKKATIYLELIKNDNTIIAMSRKTVKTKGAELAKLNLNPTRNIRITPGSGYHLRLRMYEGETKNITKLASEVIIEDVNLTRLLYTKL